MRSVTGHHLARALGAWRDHNAAQPTYAGLAEAIRLLALDGRLALGTRLPSERQLSTALGVSRTTVAGAYDALRRAGYVASQQGSGTWTTLPDSSPMEPAGAPFAPPTADTSLDFAHAAPEAPGPALRAAYEHALNALPHHLSSHGYHLLGLPALRERIAERFTSRGLSTTPEQVMVTSGAQQAFMLVLRLAGRAGDRVVVDHPAYPNTLDAIRQADLRPVPVTLTDDGWDLDAFSAAVRQSAPRIAHVVPDFHNPTGLLASDDERRQLARMLTRSHTLTVVDETLTDLGLDATPPPPLAGYAPGIITVGTASKTFWGGLRIGWIRADQASIRKLAAVRASVDIASPVLEQEAVIHLHQHIDDVLPGLHARLRERRDALIELLAEHLPGWSVRVPAGGLVLWCNLGAPVSSRLTAVAEQHGLRLAAGPRFGVDGAFERHLRLPYTQPVDVLERGVAVLKQAYAAVTDTSARAGDNLSGLFA